MRRWLLCLWALAGCGFDALLLTPRGFDPTPPPRVVLLAETEGPAMITVITADERAVATVEATAAGEIEIALPTGVSGRGLRVIARLGSRTTKTIVPDAPAGQFTSIGRLDARSTAIAQLLTFEIVGEAGSTFGGTPPAALRGLLRKMNEAPTPALEALVAWVADALGRVGTDGSAPALFDPRGFEASPEALAMAGLSDGDYRALLAAAARDYGLEVRCDPSRLNVMFAVDLSGRARDGNGAPQLVRQPPKEDRVFVGFTADESSPIAGDALPKKLVPNDPTYAMTDDGLGGDELAGDGVYTVMVPLPRGARILYKYTDGAAGEGFTGTEEWPGNARILEIEDVLSGRPDGEADCVIVRRDAFGDEAANKNFVNIHSRARAAGGTVGFDLDLGGNEAPIGPSGFRLGGLGREDLRSGPGLTPAGVPEARENGVCSPCPAPIVLDPDDATPPALLGAVRTAVDHVRVAFSEPVSAEDARDVGKFLVLDDAGRAVRVRSSRANGSDVLLSIDPSHPTNPFRLQVRAIGDVSAARNLLESAEVTVGPDVTPPRIVSARALSRLDLDPTLRLPDPTVGEVIELILDELPEQSAASDPARFAIDGLEVRGAAVVEGAPAPTVRLVTAVQEKGRRYTLVARGLRDVAGNAVEHAIEFDGFALYRVTFSAVPGFALLSADGAERGIPRGEKLYLTGTPLGAARALDGRDVSIDSRTDVTGWPAFEMKPSGREYVAPSGARAMIYELDLLLPPGSWAWKVAHGVEGEFASPPPTLEKVAKTLATTNDNSGVRVDPITLRADNGLEYGGARLAVTGDEPARRGTLFKRESPDEACDVRARDVACPLVIVGTWRDAQLTMGRSADYDDGLVALPLHRPELPDFSAPRLLDARALDSSTIVLSFDERVIGARLEVQLSDAANGHGLRAAVLETTELPPHQVVVRVAEGSRLADGGVYTVRYRGATDALGHVDRVAKTATVLAPALEVPVRPLTDRSPPQVLTATVTDISEVVVRFDERLDPATVTAGAFTIAGLAVSGVELLPDRASVRLTTARQTVGQAYVLTVTGVGDVSDPANVLASATVPFRGFTDARPPVMVRARAIAPNLVVVRFDEALDPASAAAVASWSIDGGATIVSATFGDDPSRRARAFNSRLAPRIRDTVLLATSALEVGRTYVLSAPGVTDLAGNRASGGASITGVSEPPRVDVVLEVQIADTIAVAGQIPSRAISPSELAASREGVFVLGARALDDGTPVTGASGPVNDVLRGFPREGLPLDGLEPALRDDGAAPDRVAGDGVWSILLPGVPLGTTIAWKAFAPYSVAYRDRAPGDALAAFADASPGPSAFGDGQEFPGNENGAVILDEGATPGVVRVRALFGDEITYKKFSSAPAFVWVTGDRGP